MKHQLTKERLKEYKYNGRVRMLLKSEQNAGNKIVSNLSISCSTAKVQFWYH